MFILSEVAGVPGPQPRRASLARSPWLCGLPRDKAVMKPDWNNTDHQRKPFGRTARPDCSLRRPRPRLTLCLAT